MKRLLIQAVRESYGRDDVKTMTVGELIEYLQNYDDDLPVVFAHDRGYITTNRDFILVDEALSKDNFLIKSKKHWGISHWMPLPKIPKDGEHE